MTKQNHSSAKGIIVAAALALVLPASMPAQTLLPKPAHCEFAKGHNAIARVFSLENADTTTSNAFLTWAKTQGAQTGNAPQKTEQSAARKKPQTPVMKFGTLNGNNNEAYSLRVTPDSIIVCADSDLGFLRASQTAAQLLHNGKLACADISDQPAFEWRGAMIDVSRHFFPISFLKKQVDILSRYKINRLHLHLTDAAGWRIEIKRYPRLMTEAAWRTEASWKTWWNEGGRRYSAPDSIGAYGGFYSQTELRDLVAYAAQRGITIVPEIEMPAHSEEVLTAYPEFSCTHEPYKQADFCIGNAGSIDFLEHVLDEVMSVFPSEYIHIGGDEVTVKPGFLEEMAAFVRDTLRKKVVVWNPIRAVRISKEIADMTQMWSTAGRVVEGMPNIDCRYNYINHFDVYADLVGIFKSNIYYADRGNENLAGAITAIWNDTKLPSQRDIIQQNNFYANALATAERAWQGGGKQYIEQGGTTLPNEGEELAAFTDFERRFLFHKAHTLAAESVPYVKQTNIHWRITEPFPNDGDAGKTFPPETIAQDPLPAVFNYEGKTYGSRLATGGGIYLRHIWHPRVPSFFEQPANGQTAYAWTYVFSPKTQTMGAQIEFYTYSRSGNEYSPTVGKWDRRGSQVWVNGVPVPAPFWKRVDTKILQDQAEDGLTNENFTSRPPVPVKLKKGWNKVLLKLPHANNGGTGRDKWQFTFVLTTPNGKDAAPGLIYSPERRK